jgi:energy-coupling factor transporter transmembrane protein EcfT
VLESRHPLAKLAMAALLILAASVTEQVEALAALAFITLILLLAERKAPWRLARRMAPFLFLAAAMSWIYVVADNPAYRAVAGSGWTVALLVFVRVLTMGLVSLALIETTRPGDLARALEQQTGLPRRIVYGVLAAIQFLPALAEDYRMLRLVAVAAANEAPSGSRLARALRRGLAGRTLDGLLVLLAGAIRRAHTTALSLQMRGLTAASRPSQWRRRRMTPADWLFCALATALGVGCVVAGV